MSSQSLECNNIFKIACFSMLPFEYQIQKIPMNIWNSVSALFVQVKDRCARKVQVQVSLLFKPWQFGLSAGEVTI